MHRVKKLILLAFLLIIIRPGCTQTLEQLEDKIANTWRDSLAKHIPKYYSTEEYFTVEKDWDRKIINLENKDVVQYLTLKGELKAYGDLLNGKVFVPIARKALTGSEFHMSLYGKSSKNSDIKPALIELGQVVCTCLEQKAVTIENKLTYEQQDALRNQYLGECFQANLESYRSQLFLEYNIKDQSSIQKFGSISTGFFFTNCTPIIEANAQAKASIWGSGIHLQRNRNYSKSAWTVVNATKEKITDSLANQFINLQSFKDAKAGLAQAQVILKSNPRAYSMTRPKDETKKENRTTQIFNFIANKKALFQLVIEYETDAYSKLRTVVFVPREKIKNLQELDKTLESSPPPPTEELPKND